MARNIQTIPVLSKQPKIKAAGVGNGHVNQPIRSHNSFYFPKRAVGIRQMFQDVVQANNVKKTIRECGLIELALIHMESQGAGLSNPCSAGFNSVRIPAPAFETIEIRSPAAPDIQNPALPPLRNGILGHNKRKKKSAPSFEKGRLPSR